MVRTKVVRKKLLVQKMFEKVVRTNADKIKAITTEVFRANDVIKTLLEQKFLTNSI